MLDHSAGIAKAAGAELVVFHPGFLLGRTREDALDSVVEQLGELRERLEGKDRAVPFGVEVMGRVRELGSLDDVLEISRRCGWVRPVLDFAHMHATSDGAFTDVEPFAAALEAADEVLEPGAPFHIHFSDIAYANRNETKHLPYGEGTLRADPLGEALAHVRASGDGDLRVARRGVESGDPGGAREPRSSAGACGRERPSRRASSSAASSSRPRSRRNSSSASSVLRPGLRVRVGLDQVS